MYHRKTSPKLEARWKKGILLGVKPSSTERIIGDSDGIWIVLSIVRMPREEAWEKTFADMIRGVPWKLRPDPEGAAGAQQEAAGGLPPVIGGPVDAASMPVPALDIRPVNPEVPQEAATAHRRPAPSRSL